MMPPERPVGGAPGPHSVAARRGGRVAEGIIDGVRPLSAGLAAAALALALAACGGGRAVGAVPGPSTSTPTPTPTPACRSALAAGLHTLTLGGRSTLVEVPAGSGLHPLVLDLHGYGELATQQDSYTGLSGAGAAAGVVVLTPQALGTPPAWNFPQRTAVLPDDVAALTEEVDYAEAYLCADPDHVVATGYSDGADMADTLACARPGLVTAVVGVAPSVVPPGGCGWWRSTAPRTRWCPTPAAAASGPRRSRGSRPSRSPPGWPSGPSWTTAARRRASWRWPQTSRRAATRAARWT